MVSFGCGNWHPSSIFTCHTQNPRSELVTRADFRVSLGIRIEIFTCVSRQDEDFCVRRASRLGFLRVSAAEIKIFTCVQGRDSDFYVCPRSRFRFLRVSGVQIGIFACVSCQDEDFCVCPRQGQEFLRPSDPEIWIFTCVGTSCNQSWTFARACQSRKRRLVPQNLSFPYQ